MRNHAPFRLMQAACAAVLIGAVAVPASAQDVTIPHRRHLHSAIGQQRPKASAPTAPVAFRNLTIVPRQGPGATQPGDDDDLYLDGEVRYNSIRTFDPAPYADSGKQFPLGLDGIGGTGSDLGFGAGHDSTIYDRGF